MPTVQDPAHHSPATPPQRPPPPACRPIPSTRPHSAGSQPVPRTRRTHSTSPTHNHYCGVPTASASLHLSSESLRGSREHLRGSQSRGGSSRQCRPTEPLRGTREPAIRHDRRRQNGQPSRPQRQRQGDRRRSSASDQRRNSSGQQSRTRRARPEITIVAARPMADHPAFADGDKGGYIPPEAPPTYEQAMRTPLPVNPTFTDPAVPDHISEVRRVFSQTQIINSDVITVPSYSSSVTSQAVQHTPTVTSSITSQTSITSSYSEPLFSTTSISNSLVTSQRTLSSGNVTSQTPIPRQRNTNHSNNNTPQSTRRKTTSSPATSTSGSEEPQNRSPPHTSRPTTSSPDRRNLPPPLPTKKPVLKPKPRTTTPNSNNNSNKGPQRTHNDTKEDCGASESPKPHARLDRSENSASKQDHTPPIARTNTDTSCQGNEMAAKPPVPASRPNNDVMSLFDSAPGSSNSTNVLAPAPPGGSAVTQQSNNVLGFDSMNANNPLGGNMNNGAGMLQNTPQMKPMGAPMRPSMPPRTAPIKQNTPQMSTMNLGQAPMQNSLMGAAPLHPNQMPAGAPMIPNQINSSAAMSPILPQGGTPIQPQSGAMNSIMPTSGLSAPLLPMNPNSSVGSNEPQGRYAAFGDLFGGSPGAAKSSEGKPPPQSTPTISGAQNNYSGLGDLFGGAGIMGNTPPQINQSSENSRSTPTTASNSMSPSSGYMQQGLLSPSTPSGNVQQGLLSSPTHMNTMMPSSGNAQQGLMLSPAHMNSIMPPAGSIQQSSPAHINAMAVSSGAMHGVQTSPSQMNSMTPSRGNSQQELVLQSAKPPTAMSSVSTKVLHPVQNTMQASPTFGNPQLGAPAPSSAGLLAPTIMQPMTNQQSVKPPPTVVANSTTAPSGQSPGSRKLPPPPRPSVGPQRKPNIPKTAPPSKPAPVGPMSPTKPAFPNQPQSNVNSMTSAPPGGLLFNSSSAGISAPPQGGTSASISTPQTMDIFSMDNTTIQTTSTGRKPPPSDLFLMDSPNQSGSQSQGLLPPPVNPAATPRKNTPPNLGDSPNPVIEPVYAAVTKKRLNNNKLEEEKGQKINTTPSSGASLLDMVDSNVTPHSTASKSDVAPSKGASLLDMLEPSKDELVAAELGDSPPPLPVTRPPLEDFEDLLSPTEMSKAMAEREKSQNVGASTQNSMSKNDDLDDIFGLESSPTADNQSSGSSAAIIEPVYESGSFKDMGLPHVKQSSAPPVLPTPRSKKLVSRTSSSDLGPNGAPLLPKNPPKPPEGSTVVYSATDPPSPEATLVNVRKKSEDDKSLKKKLRRTSMKFKQSTMSFFKAEKKPESEDIKSPPPDGKGETPKRPGPPKPKPPRPAGPPPSRPSALPTKATSNTTQQSSLISPIDNQPALMIAQSPTQIAQPSLLMDTPIVAQPSTQIAQPSLLMATPLVTQTTTPAAPSSLAPVLLIAQSPPAVAQSSPRVVQSTTPATNSLMPTPRSSPSPKQKPTKPPPPKITPTRSAPARPPPRKNSNQNNHIPSPTHKNVNLLDAPTPKPRSNSKTDSPLLGKPQKPAITPVRTAPSKPNVKPSRLPPALPAQRKTKPAAGSAAKPVIVNPQPASRSKPHEPLGVSKVRETKPKVVSKEHEVKSPPILDHTEEIDSAPRNPGLTAMAMYDFNGTADDELAFNAGDNITMVTVVNDDWLKGWCNGKSGIFPRGFVALENNQLEQLTDALSASSMSSQPIEDTPPTVSQSHQIDYTSQAWDDDPIDVSTQIEPDKKEKSPSAPHGPPKPPRAEERSETPSSDMFFDASDEFSADPVTVEAVTSDSNIDLNPSLGSTEVPKATVTSSQVTTTTGVIRRSSTALFSFAGQDGSELSFKEGDVITITGQVNEEWFIGELGDNSGIFPASFVQENDADVPNQLEITHDHSEINVQERVKADPISTDLSTNIAPQQAISGGVSTAPPSGGGGGFVEPMATAVKDYTATSSDEISFKVDDVLFLLQSVDADWFEVQHDQSGAVGNVPKTHVKVIHPLP